MDSRPSEMPRREESWTLSLFHGVSYGELEAWKMRERRLGHFATMLARGKSSSCDHESKNSMLRVRVRFLRGEGARSACVRKLAELGKGAYRMSRIMSAEYDASCRSCPIDETDTSLTINGRSASRSP